MPTAVPPVSINASSKECIHFKGDKEIRTPAPRRASSRESLECHAEEDDAQFQVASPSGVQPDSSDDLYNAKLSNHTEMIIELVCDREFETHFYATERLVASIHQSVLKLVLGDRSNMIMAMIVADESEEIPGQIWRWFQDRNIQLVAKITSVLDQIPDMQAAKHKSCFEQQELLWDIQAVRQITMVCDLGFTDFHRAMMYVRGCMILYLRQSSEVS